MSKTYEALMKAERLRAAQDPGALARRVARTAEEGESLRADLGVCQERIAALAERVEAAAAVGPAALEDFGRQVARLAAEQERLAAEPRRLLDAATRQLNEEIDRRLAEARSQSDQVAVLSQRVEELQGGVVAALEALRRQVDELQRRADEPPRTWQAEKQTLAASLESLREATARAARSVDEQQNEQKRLVEELAAVRAAQPNAVRDTQRLAALSESFESLRERLETVDAARRSEAGRLQAEVESLKEGVDRLRVALAETSAAPVVVSPPEWEALRGELDTMRIQLAAADEHHRRLGQGWEEQLAEQQRGLASLSDQVMRAVQESLQDSQAAQRVLADRLADIEATQSRGDPRVPDLAESMEGLRTAQTQSAGEVDALGKQVAELVEAQARQQQLSADVRQAQTSAVELGRRVTANEEARKFAMDALRQQVDALQAESGTWRDVSAAVQSAQARQEETAGEIDTLRSQIADLLENERRQQQLFADLRMAPAGGEEAAAADSLDAAPELAKLQRQVVALQADRLRLDAFLETRFELLCGVLDEQLQAQIDEIRGGGGPAEPGRASRNVLPAAVGRWASSITRPRKKGR